MSTDNEYAEMIENSVPIAGILDHLNTKIARELKLFTEATYLNIIEIEVVMQFLENSYFYNANTIIALNNSIK